MIHGKNDIFQTWGWVHRDIHGSIIEHNKIKLDTGELITLLSVSIDGFGRFYDGRRKDKSIQEIKEGFTDAIEALKWAEARADKIMCGI